MKELYRNRKGKFIGGVCAGLAEYLNTDKALVRIVTVIALFVMPPVALVAYFCFWLFLPLKPEDQEVQKPGTGETPPALTGGTKNRDTAAPAAAGPQGAGRWIAIFFAVLIIFLGVMFLIPNSWAFMIQYAPLGGALFLLLAAGKLGYDIISEKDYSLVRFSIAAVSLTFAVVIILVTFHAVKNGAYAEYFKFLGAGVLVVIGTGLILRNSAKKWIGLFAGGGVYILVLAMTLANSNYDVLGMTGGWVRDLSMKTGVSGRNVFSVPAGVKDFRFRVGCSGGSLRIDPTTNFYEYETTGVFPLCSTNAAGGTVSLDFRNRAANTRLWLNSAAVSDMVLSVSGGHLESDLSGFAVSKLDVKVSAGDAWIGLGGAVSSVVLKVNMGSIRIRLPRNAVIRIRSEGSLSHVSIPGDFIAGEGQAYVYRGGGPNVLEIDARANMGNIYFEF